MDDQWMTEAVLNTRCGRVERSEGHGCWVQFVNERCAGCSGHCGRRDSRNDLLFVPIRGDVPAIGESVEVGVPRRRLNAVLLLLFGVPTVSLIGVSATCRALLIDAPDSAVVAAGLGAFGVALMLAVWVVSRLGGTLQPRIVAVAGVEIRDKQATAVRLLNNM